jgi:hypothetical protein
VIPGHQHIVHQALVQMELPHYDHSDNASAWVQQTLLEVLDELLTEQMEEDGSWLLIDKLKLEIHITEHEWAHGTASVTNWKQQLRKNIIAQWKERDWNAKKVSANERLTTALLQYLLAGWLPSTQHPQQLQDWLSNVTDPRQIIEAEPSHWKKVLQQSDAWQRWVQWVPNYSALEKWLPFFWKAAGGHAPDFERYSQLMGAQPIAEERKMLIWRELCLVSQYLTKQQCEELFQIEGLFETESPAWWSMLPSFSPETKAQIANILDQSAPAKAMAVAKAANQLQQVQITPLLEDLNNWTKEDAVLVSNAGLVLLAPFIPTFFESTGIRPEASVTDATAGVWALHYLATGETTTDDWTLVLPKILCGLPATCVCPSVYQSPQVVHEQTSQLLEAAIAHWSKLGNISITSLRESFIKRSGTLTNKQAYTELAIPAMAFDILLQFVPWNYKMIRLPWMNQLLMVKWGD